MKTSTQELSARPKWAARALQAVCCAAVIGLGTAAYAADPVINYFELDGDVIDNVASPIDDWANLYNNTDSATIKSSIPIVDGNPVELIFQAAKNLNDISSWSWTEGSANDKTDIINAGAALYGNRLYFFADRVAQNGNAWISFWLLKDGVSLNPDGSFNGVHSVGDILLVSQFVNGGSVAVIEMYEWNGSGLTFIASSDDNPALAARVNTGDVASVWPYQSKFGAPNIYPANAFFEGGVDLGAFQGSVDPCFASFMITTQQSQSPSSSMSDFVLGNFATSPTVAATGGTACAGDSVLVSATVTAGPSGIFAWTVPQGAANPGNVASFQATVAGSYSVTVTSATGCVSDPAIATVIINPAPVASIAGSDGPVCPNTPNLVYSGPADMDSYAWTIEGNGSIVGSSSSQSVSVTAGAGCNNSFTLKLKVTKNNCESVQVSKTVNVVDITAPTFSFVPSDATIACPAVPSFGTPVYSDNCGGQVNISHVDTPLPAQCPATSVTRRSWTITDSCGNTSVASQTITVEDNTPPVITGIPAGADLGCNPANKPTVASITALLTVTDACVTPNLSVTSVDGGTGCAKTRTFTISATDGCNPTTPVVRVFNWTEDDAAPTINLTAGTSGGSTAITACNPGESAINAAFGTASATDNCGVVSAPFTDSSVTSNGCSRSKTRTWTSTDACGNVAVATRTVTWTVDETAPTITLTAGPSGGTTALACNPTSGAIGAAFGTASATDTCGSVTAVPADGSVQSDGCLRSQTRTWTATDACGNTALATRTVTWIVDVTNPQFVGGTPAGTIESCDQPNITAPTANDGCSGATSVSTVRSDGQALGAAFPLGSTTVTFTATDACGNTATRVITVIMEEPFVAPASLGAQGICVDELASFQATITGPFTVVSWTIAADGGSPTVLVHDGSAVKIEMIGGKPTLTLNSSSPALGLTTGVIYTVVLNITGNCNDASIAGTVQLIDCGYFCSLTQGFYGNLKGKINVGGSYGVIPGSNIKGSTGDNLWDLLMVNNLVVGKPGTSLTITKNDLTAFLIGMPAGGPSGALPAGNHTLPNHGIPTKGKGGWNNNLLGQTITLALNLRLDDLAEGDGLADLALPVGQFCTTVGSWSIPSSVHDALTSEGLPHTVSGLLELANRVLGGQYAGPVAASTIGGAAAAINEAFDECQSTDDCDI